MLVSMFGMLALGVLVLELLVLLMLFSTGSDVGVLFGEDVGDSDRNNDHIIATPH